MSSSSDDSDYNVEEYIKPDIIRHTYNNEDLISDHEQESDSSHDSSDKETDVKTDEEENANSIQEHEVNSSKITSDKRKEVASTRTNSRFILYVTNLSGETTRSMLEDFFGDAGQIKSIRIPKVRLGNFAFVEMTDIEGFKAGLKFNGKELDERKIQVYPGSKNKKHASTKSKNLKRKTQQQNLAKLKMRKQNIE